MLNGGESDLSWLDDTLPAFSSLTDEEIDQALESLDIP